MSEYKQAMTLVELFTSGWGINQAMAKEGINEVKLAELAKDNEQLNRIVKERFNFDFVTILVKTSEKGENKNVRKGTAKAS